MLNRREQVHSYSGPLAACAHALGGLYGRFGISGHATYAYNQLEPDGSHPAADPLFSSDQLQVMHTGTSHTRSQKAEMLADLAQVQRSLRVCFGPLLFDPQTGMPRNCCRCEKCIRTMVTLMIMGKLEKFATFSHRRPPLERYRNPDLLRMIDDHHLKDMSEFARRHGKDDWAAILVTARERKRRASTTGPRGSGGAPGPVRRG
jgi:hypothetical protein